MTDALYFHNDYHFGALRNKYESNLYLGNKKIYVPLTNQFITKKQITQEITSTNQEFKPIQLPKTPQLVKKAIRGN